MKNKNYTNILNQEPPELLKLQKTKGQPLSLIGDIVYLVLNVLGYKQNMFYDICPYFEIGIGWGGLSLGWFFICCKDSSEKTKCHELGHTLQNANIGGWKIIELWLVSVIRYWYYTICNIDVSTYDSWWFEGQATELGTKYVNLRKTNEKGVR
jgi:hypothetical protein